MEVGQTGWAAGSRETEELGKDDWGIIVKFPASELFASWVTGNGGGSLRSTEPFELDKRSAHAARNTRGFSVAVMILINRSHEIEMTAPFEGVQVLFEDDFTRRTAIEKKQSREIPACHDTLRHESPNSLYKSGTCCLMLALQVNIKTSVATQLTLLRIIDRKISCRLDDGTSRKLWPLRNVCLW